jgi:UDP-N-acetylglucosamine 1-carboxyvinyltransferase
VLLENGDIRISMEKAAEGEISVFLDEASVTATENAVMLAAASKPGTVTVIQHAACEPHVQDLCGMLTAMGAEIEGIGSNLLTVHGAGGVLRGCDFTIGSDYMEIGSFIGLAAATGGEVTVHGIERRYMPMMELGFARLGISWEYDAGGTVLHVPAGQRRKIVPDVGGMIPHIDDGPWPGFPSDLMSILAVAATQSEGTLLIHEKMFESRMFFIDMLIRMGARIVLCDPHRAVISGPSRLRGQRVDSPDVRAGMALVIAALCAEGTSEIRNIYQIERGYEHLCEKLISLGADISRDSAET